MSAFYFENDQIHYNCNAVLNIATGHYYIGI